MEELLDHAEQTTWRSVEDELPKEFESVYMFPVLAGVYIGHYEIGDKKNYWYIDREHKPLAKDPTHWLPIHPPQGEE